MRKITTYTHFLRENKQKRAALANLDKVSDRGIRKSLRRGLHAIYYMLNHDLQIEYSIVSEIELLFGRARGKVIESAAKEGIPDRMWSRLREDEINKRLNVADLTDIRKKIDNFSCSLEDLGIAVLNRRHTRDVLELTKGIAGLIFMSVVDIVIYASALVAHADYLITADEYLRKTVNHIHNPAGGACYEETRRRLLELLDPNVRLPFAFTLTADGEIQPPLPSSEKSRQ